MIKRISIAFFILIALPSYLSAEGIIYLFSDSTATSISADIEMYGTRRIYIAYSSGSGQGPDGIRGMEFMVECSEPNIITGFGPETWRSDVTVIYLGSVWSGISVVTSNCVGVGEDFVFFGYFEVFSVQEIIGSQDPWVELYVRPDPNALEQGIWVVACDENRSLHDVYGNYFCFPENSSVCRHANRTSSWGAIKTLYNN